MALGHFKFGWPALERALNELVDAVNGNEPMEGEGTHIEKKGKYGITIHARAAQGGQGSPTTTGGGGMTIPGKVFIQNTKWQEVILVDSSTCQESVSSFLSYSSGDQTEYDVKLNNDGSWNLVSN